MASEHMSVNTRPLVDKKINPVIRHCAENIVSII